MSVDEYIIQNTQSNIWADHLIIQALADSLPNYRFEIIRSNGDRNIIEPRNIEDNPTTIRLYYTGNHYMAIVQDPEELIDMEVIEAEDNMQEVENQIIGDYTNNIDNDVIDVLGEQFQI